MSSDAAQAAKAKLLGMMSTAAPGEEDLVSLGLEEPELVLHPRQLSIEEERAKNMMVRHRFLNLRR